MRNVFWGMFLTFLALPALAGTQTSVGSLEGQYLSLCKANLAFLAEDASSTEKVDRYISEFNKSVYSKTLSPVGKRFVFQKVKQSQVTFVGDYHLTSGPKGLLFDVLDQSSEPVTLVIEFIDKSHQDWIDDYLSGRSTLKKIPRNILRRWNFGFQMYAAILKKAKSRGDRILAVDTSDTADKKRDEEITKAVIRDIEKNPNGKYVVFYGEGHLSGKDHLPDLFTDAGYTSQVTLLNMLPYHYFRVFNDPDLKRNKYFQISENQFEVITDSPVERKGAEVRYNKNLGNGPSD